MIAKTDLAGQLMNAPAVSGGTSAPGKGAVDVSGQFGKLLETAIDQLNAQNAEVDELTKQFATGQLTDIHQLLIASEKASLGLELTVQIRNKMIEAYQEIMRMQL
ncbi:MAG TPA: flagellar hook-basal body complex protein FliE [Bacilli bacterium]